MDNLTIAAQVAEDFGIGDAALTAIFGYAVDFFGLIILMIVISIVASVFKKKDAKAAAAAKAEADAKAKAAAAEKKDAPAVQAETAPGSAGHVKLYDVPDKEAAMIMAIVADKLQKPLNELRFISIKEVK